MCPPKWGPSAQDAVCSFSIKAIFYSTTLRGLGAEPIQNLAGDWAEGKGTRRAGGWSPRIGRGR